MGDFSPGEAYSPPAFEDEPQSVGVRPAVGIIRQEGDLLELEYPPALELGRRPQLAQDGDPDSIDGNSVHAGQGDAGLDVVAPIWPAAGAGLDGVEDEERTRRAAEG